MKNGNGPETHALRIVHDRVPNRMRFHVPLIQHQRTLAETLRHRLLDSDSCRGIYHAEVNPLTASLLLKFHGGINDRRAVLEVVRDAIKELEQGNIEILLKHKNPRVGRMMPGAFFTRELIVNIVGNTAAAILIAALGLNAWYPRR
jgi:hypothetical protein